jgi:conjugal transfer pilus assembly protein TraL
MASHRIPRTIDDMPYAFIWRMDEFAVPIIMMLVGMLLNYAFTALFLGIGLVYFYRKYREGRPNLYVLHLCYWWGFTPLSGHSMLNTWEREYWS